MRSQIKISSRLGIIIWFVSIVLTIGVTWYFSYYRYQVDDIYNIIQSIGKKNYEQLEQIIYKYETRYILEDGEDIIVSGKDEISLEDK